MADERNSNVILLPRRRTRSPLAALLRLPLRSRQRSVSTTPSTESTISDYELHAFVDDALDRVRRERVQTFLLWHPTAAADAAAYRRQNRLLRDLRRERSSLSPAITYLSAQLARRLAQARGRRMLAWSAAAVVLAAAAASVLEGVDLAAVPHVFLTAGR